MTGTTVAAAGRPAAAAVGGSGPVLRGADAQARAAALQPESVQSAGTVTLTVTGSTKKCLGQYGLD